MKHEVIRRLANRESEAMKDGPDAVPDRPQLNGVLDTVSGATSVSPHHGGGTMPTRGCEIVVNCARG